LTDPEGAPPQPAARAPVRGARLAVRLGFALTVILFVAALAQYLLYISTREETLEEADALYEGLSKAIEVGATQIGAEGWKDTKALDDFVRQLKDRGLRDIKVTDAGRPLNEIAPTPTPGPGRRKAKPTPSARDLLISGVVGEGVTNRTLVIPMVIEGKLYGHLEIKYSLQNIRQKLADNFRRRLFALLGVFAGGLAVMLVLIRNATLPLDELADGVAQVAEGRLDVRVPVDRDDEIGRLAETFNQMTDALQKRKELEVRLAAAEKRAEIGHLASGLAHEIKNPLNALSLGLDVLRRRHRPADETAAAEYSARIVALREEIDRLTTLINNFLAFGRPLSLTLGPVDFAPVVETTLSDLQDLADRAHVALSQEITAGLPRVYADGSLLKSAVWNLIQNGVQSMERTGGTLRVVLKLEDVPEGASRRIALTVEDEGPGIDENDLPRLFEPYFSKKEGGVGLGLAMVRRIVEDHGGRVSAENRSAPERGARFGMTLPVAL